MPGRDSSEHRSHDSAPASAGRTAFYRLRRVTATQQPATGGGAVGKLRSSQAEVLAATLLCVLLGLMADLMKQARESQDRTEVLLAQLEHARSADTGCGDRQTRSDRARAARCAGALDVWRGDPAAGRADARPAEQASPQIRAAIDGASELVKDGLANARQVVGALRGEQLPGSRSSTRWLTASA